MDASYLVQTIVIPLALGLLGFVEPCSIGSSLIVIKCLEGRSRAGELAELVIFAVTRAVFIGGLGVVAVLIGTAFLGFQRAGWIALGILYVVLGLLYVSRRIGAFTLRMPRIAAIGPRRGAVGLGLLLGLNIPGCAAPLILGLLGIAAARGTSGGTLISGFMTLAVFGVALSLPLVALVLIPCARRALDRLAGLSRRLPVLTGLVLVVLGLWSIGFGAVASFGTPR